MTNAELAKDLRALSAEDQRLREALCGWSSSLTRDVLRGRLVEHLPAILSALDGTDSAVAADRERIAKIIEWNTEEREIDYPSVEISAAELIEAVRAGTPIEHFLREELAALTLHPRGQCACHGEGFCRWCRQNKAQEEIDALAGKP